MNNEKMRVLLTTNIPAPYLIDYVTELGKKTDLTVLFEIERAKDRDAAWYGSENTGFKSVFLKGIPYGNESGFSLKIIKYLSAKKFDRIIIANPTTPTGIAALLYCRYFKVPFVIQSEGGMKGSGKGLKEKFKKYIMESADFYLTGMAADENNYFMPYGATKERLLEYPFSSLTRKDMEVAKELLSCDKKELRRELGMCEKHIILSVGRFSYLAGYGKGYDILMRMAERTDADIGFYIIGDEPTSEFVEWKRSKKLDHVHFIPFKQRDVLAKYYAAADVFAILTRGDSWGLVVNEAMSYGLPVVSSDKCVAGLQLIENDVNGYILSLDDEPYIYKTLSELVRDNEKCRRFGRSGLEKIQAYTIENMTDIIFEYIS